MRFSSWLKLVCGGLLTSIAPTQSAESYHFQSGDAQTMLLELYTSEGCSSCPPAEAWFSRLKESPKLWQDFVPVAFHVDYWDYLGWKDPLAKGAYTQRQQGYAAQWRSRSVYTPGFVLDGKESRGGLSRDDLPRASSKRSGMLAARSDDGRNWKLRFQPAADSASSSWEFHAVLLGFDLTSDVNAGENRGRRLQHDFAVLTMTDGNSSKSGDSFQGTLSLNNPTSPDGTTIGFAAWVTSAKSLQPLQAVGGWLTTTKKPLPATPNVGR